MRSQNLSTKFQISIVFRLVDSRTQTEKRTDIQANIGIITTCVRHEDSINALRCALGKYVPSDMTVFLGLAALRSLFDKKT